MQASIKDTLIVNNDKATVFKALIDIEEFKHWRAGLENVYTEPGGEISEGTDIISIYKNEEEELSVVERVLKLDFPNELVVQFIAPDMKDVVQYRFEEEGSQTRINFKTTKKNLGFMQWTIIISNKKAIRQLTRETLNQFKNYVEKK